MKKLYSLLAVLVFFAGIPKVYSEVKQIDYREIIKKNKAMWGEHNIDINPNLKISPEKVAQFFVENNNTDMFSNQFLLVSNNGDKFLPKEIKQIDVRYSCSSFLGEKYLPVNLFDADKNTVWTENVKGYGFGEWIKIDINVPNNSTVRNKQEIAPFTITIFPGHGKSLKLFKENNRLRTAVLIGMLDEKGEMSPEGVKFSRYAAAWRLHFDDEYYYHIWGFRLYNG